MIGVKLMGGLGNQMFQYAAARGLAKRRDTEVGIDKSWYKYNSVIDTPRHYELGCFSFKPHFLKLSQTPIDPGLFYYQGRQGKLRLKLHQASNHTRLQTYVEQGSDYNKEFSNLPDDTFLFGWWQTEKYFVSAKAEIVRDFQYANQPNNQNMKMLSDIANCNSVSLHVRRGDYVHDKNTNQKHGTKTLDYYQQAIKHIVKKVKNPKFFVISDDPAWCKQNLKFDYPTVYVTHNTAGEEDMRLMRACKHNIIANSSFSWWGAWLNENPGKIVIAPKQWFNDPSINPKDIIPSTWLRV
jgi:hypothetical protein